MFAVVTGRDGVRFCPGDREETPDISLLLATMHAHAGREPNRTWAELMQRSLGFDVLACPRCPGRLKLVALIQESTVVQRILGHLGLPRDPPTMWSARALPLPFAAQDHGMSGDDY